MEFRHLKLVLRWIWLLVLFPILAVGAGFMFLQSQPTTYEARAILIIGPGIDSPNPDLDALRTGAQLMQTYAELPRTDAFQKRIIDQLSLNLSPGDLDEIMIIRPVVDTQLLQIIVQYEDADLAMDIANAVGNELVNLGPSNEQNDFLFNRISEQASNIEEAILSIEEQIDINTEQLEIEQDAVNRALLIQQIAEEQRRLSEANNTLADLYSVLQAPLTNRIMMIDNADDTVPLASETALTLVVAAGAGLIISALVAIGLIVLEDQVIDVENLRYMNNLPLWGVIRPSKVKGRLPVKTASDTFDAQQYYQLGAQILYRRDSDLVFSILFTSLSESDYVPEIVSNLALSIANTKNSVFLMDIDFRHNEITKLFDLDNTIQLSDLFQEENPSEIGIADIKPTPHLKVLPSGDATTEHSFNMLASPKMLNVLRLIKKTSKNQRLLLVTAPPLSQMHDSLTVVSQLDLVVLVVNNRKVTQPQLQQAIAKLEAVGAKVGGMILVNQRGIFN